MKIYIFSISSPRKWILEGSEEFVAVLDKLIKLRSENDFELHIEEVGKRGRVLQMLGPDPNNPKIKVVIIGVEIY